MGTRVLRVALLLARARRTATTQPTIAGCFAATLRGQRERITLGELAAVIPPSRGALRRAKR
jgi:hypothetical protein